MATLGFRSEIASLCFGRFTQVVFRLFCCSVPYPALRSCGFVYLKRICSLIQTFHCSLLDLFVRFAVTFIWFVRCFFLLRHIQVIFKDSQVIGRTDVCNVCMCALYCFGLCLWVCVQLYIVNCALYTAGCVLQTLALAGFCDWRFSCVF